jgi:hypothetical protein
MTESLEDIQLFLDMKYRMFGQAVSKYMIVSVCVMFRRHLTPRSKGYFVRISMVVSEKLNRNVMRSRLSTTMSVNSATIFTETRNHFHFGE